MSEPKPIPITADHLREILHYDEITGVFTWLSSANSRSVVGMEAGCLDVKGYRRIGIGKKLYRAHRLAWIYHYGAPPKHQIDHKNGNRSDNRISNLREATQVQNAGNMGVRTRNTSGFVGVSWSKQGQKWKAQCGDGKKNRYIGLFSTPEEASEAYQKAAKSYRGEFFRQANIKTKS